MHRSDDSETSPIDWRGWAALTWMAVFGLLYALMLLDEKAPGLLARISAGR